MLARARAALLETREIGELERHVHGLLELAAVIGEREPGLERHRLRRDVVLAPQLRGIDAELVGGKIDQPLDHVRGLRTAISAIGSHRACVGEHGGDVGEHGGRAVHAGERADIAGERRHAGLQIGADRGNRLHAHAEERAVLVQRKLRLGDVVARLRVAKERFGARRGPFHRPAHTFRREQHECDLVIDRRLHAETAANVAGDNANPALGNL